MTPARQARQLAKTVLLVALTAAMAAAAMVPAFDRQPAKDPTRGDAAAASAEQLADFPPPAPASYVGDQYYQWATVACPTGEYRPPAVCAGD